MTVEYQNRFGDTYFLQAGKTKAGKPNYYFGKKKMTGEPVEAIPEGFEIRESPSDGRVSLRRKRPTEISPLEYEMLRDGICDRAGLRHFIVDIDGDSLIVYVPNMSEGEARELVGVLGDWDSLVAPAGHKSVDRMVTRSRYSPMLRFTLGDPAERLFRVERWCFLGSIDDWMDLTGMAAPLPELITHYVPHLGKESYYELI